MIFETERRDTWKLIDQLRTLHETIRGRLRAYPEAYGTALAAMPLEGVLGFAARIGAVGARYDVDTRLVVLDVPS